MTGAVMSRVGVAVLLTAALLAAAGFLRLPQMLGAHPFWAMKVVWIGMPLGLLFALLLWWLGLSRPRRALVASLALGGSAAAAHLGKLRFAGSFAEDRLAGQFWYFGWIGACLFAAVLLASVLLPDRHSQG